MSLQVPAPVAAQFLPTEPIRLGNGRLVVGGEASVSVAAEDDGWFNYTGYEQSTLRQVLVTASTSLSLGRRVELLGEIRTQTGRPFDVYALFVRLRPWRDRPIDVQVGRIPPTFGTFARQSYGTANWLIGSSLPYQYLTSLRPDALPATADDLLRMRARGWRPSYPVGAQSVRPGVPLVSGLAWDTGIQTRVGDGPIQVVAAVTTGSPSNPLVRDDNGGKQLATRAIWRPRAGVALGLSAARADFVSGDVRRALGAAGEGSFRQSAVGVDVELSRGHWVVRGEALSSAWTLPLIGVPSVDDALRARAWSVEGRYRLRPGFYVAARGDRLGFSAITGTLFGGAPTPWDAPVTRLEVGAGYSLTRNLIAKVAYQHNWRDDRRQPRTGFVASQILYWF